MVDVPGLAANGLNMPALGFGTWELDGSQLDEVLPEALDIGYRHIDTAQIYKNEAEVGRNLAKSGVPRDELFITTKVWVDRYTPDDLLASVQESLERLQTDYVDLLLLHWPLFEGHGMNPTLEGLMRARADGLTRHIEYHVYLGQERLRRVLARHNLVLTAYMPLAKAGVVNDTVLWEIGAQYDKTAAQVALRWLIEQDRVAAIPATSNVHHARANFEVFDFSLSLNDHQRIAQLDKDRRLCAPASLSPDWDD
jgi:diketogulonate reductase-like aldo/keto reductase